MTSILLPDLHGGGEEGLSLTLAHGFKERGYMIYFILMQVEGNLMDEASRDFAIYDLGCTKIREVPIRLSKYLKA